MKVFITLLIDLFLMESLGFFDVLNDLLFLIENFGCCFFWRDLSIVPNLSNVSFDLLLLKELFFQRGLKFSLARATLSTRFDHNWSSPASFINFFDGALLLNKQFLDSIVHFMDFNVSVFHHFADFIKSQLVEILFIIFGTAYTTRLLVWKSRAWHRSLISISKLRDIKASARHVHQLNRFTMTHHVLWLRF